MRRAPKKVVRVFLACCVVLSLLVANAAAEQFRCGASSIDVTPRHLPVIRNGGFLQAEDNRIADPLHARCVVLESGTERVAIVVVDSCMIPTKLCDSAKQHASESTGIPTDHILISATHTHTAPSVMRFCLGSDIDERYAAFLPGKIAQAIKTANDRLRPAKVGWAQIDASHFTKCRRWITRTDKIQLDPFGERTVHANMHPGHENAEFVGPAGPIDPWLSLVSVTDEHHQPIAVLANFSMHYFSGHAGVSADYYGRFCAELSKRIAPNNSGFVGIMSQGTSGDLWWGDYAKPKAEKPFQDIEQFSNQLVDLTMNAIEDIKYHGEVPVRIAERRMTMKRRVPDEERLAWARRMNKLRGERRPKDRPEVYALQAEHLNQNPTDDVVLQAIRIGDFGITAIPNEVYALTGLKLKRRSPLDITMNVSLANGACGYIPPPEQHALGGYNTWPATTAGLEVAAEPKIVGALLELLEEVAGKPRKQYVESQTPLSQFIEATKPYAYWRLNEMEQAEALETSKQPTLRPSGWIAYHLPGRVGQGFGKQHDSHAVQLAGGKLVLDEFKAAETYSLQFSFYLGTPVDFRERTATLVSRGPDALFITGSGSKTPGRLAFGAATGTTTLEPKTWYQCVFVRNGDFAQVYLNGNSKAELAVKIERRTSQPRQAVMLGGDRQNTANFEGKLDEVSLYDRALTKQEAFALFAAANNDATNANARRNDADSPKTSLDAESLDSEPLDPQTSMQQIHVRDGFQVELVAAEPLVVDPVAIDWGPDGKLWVAEMSDYPMGMDGVGSPGGRIRYLEDTDNDGEYDRSTVFMKNVSFPNGIMAWRDGVLVTAAPEIFFARDSTGDGKADTRETLFSGFMTGNQQLRVNGLRFGLDGLVHCASGAHHAGFGAGNSVFSTKLNASVRVGSRDFRFSPDDGSLDPQSGPSQFGRVRNDFGDWFGVQNSQPLWHYVLGDHYARRNSLVPAIDPRRQVRTPRMPEVFSAKPPQRRFHGFDHAGHYTSACGISIYRDDLLFPRDEIHAFTCEPFHNLVQHHTLEHDGTGFRGERANDGPVDFFASSDRWTRPVMSRTGPDGALWVVDMYRYMIEHPEWLPKQGQDALRAGYRAGDQRGRIYRIVRSDVPIRSIPSVANANSAELVGLLKHPSGIVRDQAHRALLAQPSDNEQTRESIRHTALHGELPESRVQALAVLGQLGALTTTSVREATLDQHPMVRRQAIRASERLSPDQIVDCGVLRLAKDPDAKVRLQLAQSLGTWTSLPAANALLLLSGEYENDPFMNAAIIGSLPPHFDRFVSKMRKLSTPIQDAMLLMGESKPQQLAALLEAVLGQKDSSQRFAILARWLDQLSNRNLTMDALLAKHAALRTLSAKLDTQFHQARRLAIDADLASALRIHAIALIGREPASYSNDISILDKLVDSSDSLAVQSAALERLAGVPCVESAATLIRNWPSYLPLEQQRAGNALLSRIDWSKMLLEAIEDGTIHRQDLSLMQRQTLRNSRDKGVAAFANRILGETKQRNVSSLVNVYASDLAVGNVAAGKAVFEANCTNCHTLDRDKKPIGPDLRSITNRSMHTLLTSILDPSQNVDPKYLNYSVVLKNGEVLNGVIAEEADSSLAIIDATGKKRTVLRTAIELTKRSPKSMMPEGFETKISPAAMSDLLAFLREL